MKIRNAGILKEVTQRGRRRRKYKIEMNTRLFKIFFGASIALYMAIVCFNNITDYDSNFQFVRMVSGMTDVFAKEKTGWRSVNSEALHHIMYIFIIVWELTITSLAISGILKMIRNLKSNPDEFNHSKKLLVTGLSLGVLLWFGMFIAIGGEWFLMWQSKNWNGQNTAFLLCICFLLFLIYLNQADD
jgi:predicted small integral membrane protein